MALLNKSAFFVAAFLCVTALSSAPSFAQDNDDGLIPVSGPDDPKIAIEAIKIINQQLEETDDPSARKNLLTFRHVPQLKLGQIDEAIDSLDQAMQVKKAWMSKFSPANDLMKIVRNTEYPLTSRQKGLAVLEENLGADNSLLTKLYEDIGEYAKAEQNVRVELASGYITTMREPALLYRVLGAQGKTTEQAQLMTDYPELAQYLPGPDNIGVVYDKEEWSFGQRKFKAAGPHLWHTPMDIAETCQPADCTVSFKVRKDNTVSKLKFSDSCPKSVKAKIKDMSFLWRVGRMTDATGSPTLDDRLEFPFHMRPPKNCLPN